MHTLNPGKAWLAALDVGLLVRSADPLSCATPLPDLTCGLMVPNARLYVRPFQDV